MKTYRYHPLRYFLAAIAPSILMVGLLVWGIIGFFSDHPTNLHKFTLIVIPVLLITNVGAANQSNKIEIDEESITFYGFGKSHKYLWQEMDFLRIKEFMYSDKVYVRIGKGNFLSGRYWLDIFQFEDGKELLENLKTVEGTFHPEVVKYQKQSMKGKKSS